MALTSVVTCRYLIVRCSLLGSRDEIDQAHLYEYIIFSSGMQNISMNNKYILYRQTYSVASYMERQEVPKEVNDG